MATIDHDAVTALRDEILDWRYRWVPPDWHGRRLGEVAGARLSAVDGPLATLDRAALTHNLAAMAAWCAATGVDLAPHGKTTMSPQLIAEQIGHGAWGVTVASLGQARVLRAFGISPIIVANQIVDPAGLRWVAAERERDPTFRLLCWADSAAGVELLARSGATLDVLVEIGIEGGRTGCRDAAAAVEVARAVAAAPGLTLTGISGYEGTAADLAEADRFLRRMRELAGRIAPLSGGEEFLLSAGGSAYFDRVAAILTPDAVRGPARTVIRSGCYLTHDGGHYAVLTPASRGAAGAPRFADALRVRARVLSRPEPALALLDVGRRDVPYDQGLPQPVGRTGWQVTALNDQHAFLALPSVDHLGPGDLVELSVSHPCGLFDRWNLLPVVADGVIVDVVRTFF